MKAAYYERKGDPRQVLTVGDLPTPEVAPGQVRVRVRVSAINPSDTKTRQGWDGDRGMSFPRVIPHNDGAGEIDQVGEGVSQGRVGERVWVFQAQREGRAFGTAAEFVVIPARNAVRMPDTASFDDGASMGVPGMTAHHLLFQDGAIHGKTILVQGGAGSVGHLAVQLARWAGAQVIATAGSEEQMRIARDCGAHQVLNYKTQDVPAEVKSFLGRDQGVDRVVEVSLVRNLDVDARVLRPSGVLSTYMVQDDPINPSVVDLRQLLMKDLTVHFILVYAMSKEKHAQAITDLSAALAAGTLKPRISSRFPLDAIAEAHEVVGTAGAGGKVLVDIA